MVPVAPAHVIGVPEFGLHFGDMSVCEIIVIGIDVSPGLFDTSSETPTGEKLTPLQSRYNFIKNLYSPVGKHCHVISPPIRCEALVCNALIRIIKHERSRFIVTESGFVEGEANVKKYCSYRFNAVYAKCNSILNLYVSVAFKKVACLR